MGSCRAHRVGGSVLEILGFPCLIFVTVFVTIRGTMIDEVQIEALENLKEIFRLWDGLSVQNLVGGPASRLR